MITGTRMAGKSVLRDVPWFDEAAPLPVAVAVATDVVCVWVTVAAVGVPDAVEGASVTAPTGSRDKEVDGTPPGPSKIMGTVLKPEGAEPVGAEPARRELVLLGAKTIPSVGEEAMMRS
jgi:hypothetical protein